MRKEIHETLNNQKENAEIQSRKDDKPNIDEIVITGVNLLKRYNVAHRSMVS